MQDWYDGVCCYQISTHYERFFLYHIVGTALENVYVSQNGDLYEFVAIIQKEVSWRVSQSLFQLPKASPQSLVSRPASGLLVQYDANALRAVVVLSHTQKEYFVLLGDANKACKAKRIDLACIFFFPIFREDNATAIVKRESTWSAKIIGWVATLQGMRKCRSHSRNGETKRVILLSRSLRPSR